MKIGKISKTVKSDQEQATASWINYLNQVRLDRLLNSLNTQDKNLATALDTIDQTLDKIDVEIIDRNRGGTKGMHGFIAEVSETGVGNARQQIVGKETIYKWVDDNGRDDLLRRVPGKNWNHAVPIQQKFVQSGHFSLDAVKAHCEKYPDFLPDHGKYQIPSDHYAAIKRLMSMDEKTAGHLTSNDELTYKDWKYVHEYFKTSNVKFEDLEPSKLSYDDVQAAQIHNTLDDEKESLRKTDRKIRDNAYDQSKPTLKQGAQAGAAAAAVEGGMTFVLAIVKKRRSGKKIQEFTSDDWMEIFKDTGLGTVKGGIRGVSIYALTNFTATPAAVASSLCTASFGIAEQAYLLRTGKISDEDFLMNSEILCLDCSVSALSSCIGQAVIPVPVLGAVIGNTVGTFLYQIAKDDLSRRELKLVNEYLKELKELDRKLDKKYKQYIDELNCSLRKYYSALDKAFSPDYAEAVDGSIELAMAVGVPSEKILKTKQEAYDYYMR